MSKLKFKIGDKVKLIENHTGDCGTYNNYSNKVDHFVITEILDDGDGYRYNILDKDGKVLSNCSYCFDSEDFELFKKAKPELPPKFILGLHSEGCTSSIEYFATLKDAKTRLRELVGKDIRLFEVKKELKVDIKKRVSVSIK